MALDTAHRSFPPPDRPWVMAQSWRDLVFLHWDFPPDAVRDLLPPGMALDTRDGRAWVGVVPFRMEGVRPRGLPGVPGARRFPELNVRTYVVVGETPGVFFFSLDATSRLAIAAARAWFHLPYLRAEMSLRRDGETLHYRSERRDPRGPSARFVGEWTPEATPFTAAPGTLEHWLTERYALFSVKPDGAVLRGDVHHPPWPLAQATARVDENGPLAALGLNADRPPDSVLASMGVDVQTWWPRVVYRPVSSRRH
jgi:uncharacterized protein YqjF (DUF2071 family)